MGITEKSEKACGGRRLIRPFDIVLVVLLIGLSAAYLIAAHASGGELVAVVRQNGEEIKRISLTEVTDPYDYKIDGEYNIVLNVKKGSIEFTHSDCPDKVCIKTGALTFGGSSAVCLPARVSVSVVREGKEQNNDIDVIVG